VTAKFEVEREFSHVIAKFHHPTFNRSELGSYHVDKQTDAAENIHLAPLWYAGG